MSHTVILQWADGVGIACTCVEWLLVFYQTNPLNMDLLRVHWIISTLKVVWNNPRNKVVCGQCQTTMYVFFIICAIKWYSMYILSVWYISVDFSCIIIIYNIQRCIQGASLRPRTQRQWFWTHKIRASASIWTHRSWFWTHKIEALASNWI